MDFSMPNMRVMNVSNVTTGKSSFICHKNEVCKGFIASLLLGFVGEYSISHNEKYFVDPYRVLAEGFSCMVCMIFLRFVKYDWIVYDLPC